MVGNTVRDLAQDLDPARSIHFVGVGGVGMSALAEILAARGFTVSGSDSRITERISALRHCGVRVFLQQGPQTIATLLAGCDHSPLVVVSTAVKESNPELAAVRAAGLEVVHRSDILAALLSPRQRSVAVAGSHGKTTTSTILSTLLLGAGLDPTVVVGGTVPWFGSNGHHGNDDLVVAEVDESDGTLVKFRPRLGIVTNVELDHTDHYRSLDDLLRTMSRFGGNCQTLITNADCPRLSATLPGTCQWSLRDNSTARYCFLPVSTSARDTVAAVYAGGKRLGQVKLPLAGRHNLANLAAAFSAALELGIPFRSLRKACRAIRAPGRRFELRAVVDERILVDDYAHHPTEVAATLAMARSMLGVADDSCPLPFSPHRVVTVFQPHRYSRTAQFLDAFAIALARSDVVLLTPIYGAGEQAIPGITHEALAAAVAKTGTRVKCFDSLKHVAADFLFHTRPGDLVIAMGAGSVNQLPGMLSSFQAVAA